MNPGMISLAGLGLGQCVAPPTCIAGQSLFTVPGAIATNNANSNMTDANCPTYQCLPSMTATPAVCTTAQCQSDMAALNGQQGLVAGSPVPSTASFENENAMVSIAAIGGIAAAFYFGGPVLGTVVILAGLMLGGIH